MGADDAIQQAKALEISMRPLKLSFKWGNILILLSRYFLKGLSGKF